MDGSLFMSFGDFEQVDFFTIVRPKMNVRSCQEWPYCRFGPQMLSNVQSLQKTLTKFLTRFASR